MYIPLCISIIYIPLCIIYHVYPFMNIYHVYPTSLYSHMHPYKYLPFLNRTTCPVCRQSFAHKLERRPVDKWREEGDKLIKIRRRSWLVFKRTNSAQIDKRNEWLASKKIKRREKNKLKSKETDKIMPDIDFRAAEKIKILLKRTSACHHNKQKWIIFTNRATFIRSIHALDLHAQ